jgi:hypothetical protein
MSSLNVEAMFCTAFFISGLTLRSAVSSRSRPTRFSVFAVRCCNSRSSSSGRRTDLLSAGRDRSSRDSTSPTVALETGLACCIPPL